MKKNTKGFVLGLIVATLLMSTAFGAGIEKTIKVVLNKVNIIVNGEVVEGDNILYDGTTYVPLRAIGEMLDKDIGWDGDTNTASINDKKASVPKPVKKDLIGKEDLPYMVRAKNDMAITINSYTATTEGIKLNITMTNHSSVSDKGDLMLTTYEIYDGKNTLKYIDMDDAFWDISYLRAGQSVTGNIAYQGLTHDTDTFTLYGGLWQYIDREEFKINFKVN